MPRSMDRLVSPAYGRSRCYPRSDAEYEGRAFQGRNPWRTRVPGSEASSPTEAACQTGSSTSPSVLCTESYQKWVEQSRLEDPVPGRVLFLVGS